MARTIIAEKRVGTRTILNIDWPVSSVLYRWDYDSPRGRRTNWSVSRELCNGTAEESVSFKREADARAFFDALWGDLEVSDETEKPLKKKVENDHFDKKKIDDDELALLAATILGDMHDRNDLEKAASLYMYVLCAVIQRSRDGGLSKASLDATITTITKNLRTCGGLENA